jgi:hypothetical protein
MYDEVLNAKLTIALSTVDKIYNAFLRNNSIQNPDI